jgi:hypothetical protein
MSAYFLLQYNKQKDFRARLQQIIYNNWLI